MNDFLDELSDYAANNLESFEAEELENFMGRVMPNKLQQFQSQMRAKQAPQMSAMRNMGAMAVNPIGKPTNGAIDQNAVAQVSIQVRRATNNIALALPVPIFGAISYESRYEGLLQLPSGVTATFAVTPKGDLAITFTQGLNVDIVTISCSSVPYVNMLRSTQTDVFKIRGTRYSISDVSKLAQFDTQFRIARRSIFGKTDFDDISVAAYKDPQQFQQGIIDLKFQTDIDKEKQILTEIIDSGVANFSFNLSVFVQKIDRLNSITEFGK